MPAYQFHESWTHDAKRDYLRKRVRDEARLATRLVEENDWYEANKAVEALTEALKKLWEVCNE